MWKKCNFHDELDDVSTPTKLKLIIISLFLFPIFFSFTKFFDYGITRKLVREKMSSKAAMWYNKDYAMVDTEYKEINILRIKLDQFSLVVFGRMKHCFEYSD